MQRHPLAVQVLIHPPGADPITNSLLLRLSFLPPRFPSTIPESGTTVAAAAAVKRMPPAVVGAAAAPASRMPPELVARDALLGWYRGEFAAANAIIDALCGHLTQICEEERGDDYGAVFAAVHRRRMNWIPVLHMQQYVSISDVTGELRRVADGRAAAAAAAAGIQCSAADAEEELEIARSPPPRSPEAGERVVETESVEEATATAEKEEEKEEETEEDLSGGDGGSQVGRDSLESVMICANHEDCAARPDRIKILKGFVAKEPVKGHMVNVVKGLKLYEDIFTNAELMKLGELINELRLAGRKGELSGETFIYFNKQMKGNKREIIQLGVPVFQPTKEEAICNIEPIPPILQTVIDHLVQWRLIPESRVPNSCIINFFDEDEYSQPYLKPPHLDNPISTLLLSETTMAFGRVLVCDPQGNYKGSLTLPLKEGSLLVMRGNSADMSRHVIYPSPNKRVSITFVRVRSTDNQFDTSSVPPSAKAMTIWQQPSSPPPQKVSAISYGPPAVISPWGMALSRPLLMLPPPSPIVMTTGRRSPPSPHSSSGTGVFLPWNVSPKKYTKHLPPRIQKRRLASLSSPLEAQVGKISPV